MAMLSKFSNEFSTCGFWFALLYAVLSYQIYIYLFLLKIILGSTKLS